MSLKKRPPHHKQWGYADFFDSREKRLILELAEPKPGDVLYDLGCGDASFLIFAVEQCGIEHAVGYENMPQRIGTSRRGIKERGLSDKIEIVGKDMNKDADLVGADIILDMLPQDINDIEKYSTNIRNGTRVIKHDLPLIGFMPDKIIHPFYRHTIPLVKARSDREWASKVLSQESATLHDVWHELFYYGNQKGYLKWDINEAM